MRESQDSFDAADNRSRPWFAVYVRPRHEKQVAAAFGAKGIEHFLPLRHARTRWADRWKHGNFPLFPGYVFCRLNPNEPGTIITTPGTIGIVKSGTRYAPVDDNEILLLQAATAARFVLEPVEYLTGGTPVVITAGPLSGTTGTVVTYKNSVRLLLSLTLLKRSVLAELDSNWVAPLA